MPPANTLKKPKAGRKAKKMNTKITQKNENKPNKEITSLVVETLIKKKLEDVLKNIEAIFVTAGRRVCF